MQDNVAKAGSDPVDSVQKMHRIAPRRLRVPVASLRRAQVPTPEMAVTPPSIRKSAPTTYAESSDAR